MHPPKAITKAAAYVAGGFLMLGALAWIAEASSGNSAKRKRAEESRKAASEAEERAEMLRDHEAKKEARRIERETEATERTSRPTTTVEKKPPVSFMATFNTSLALNAATWNKRPMMQDMDLTIENLGPGRVKDVVITVTEIAPSGTELGHHSITIYQTWNAKEVKQIRAMDIGFFNSQTERVGFKLDGATPVQ